MNRFRREEQVREEGMSLLSDTASLMCLGYRVERGLEPEDRFGSITPKGLWELQGWGTLLRRRRARRVVRV